ncbi:hypothetical protein BXY85_2100 [Roseivirga pacifica]|uniref:Uncharacterized protein n=1 Tax=Roseivirga pacifica TaxID=1267423 RepID=A0A1I0NDG3_9BACT|nr:hypothetical protein [Roseivirga pacifica]RKQ51078.1 hypothetical protein BXY85_2100 [Roseivirga pacifica]SEV98727.1 hypothetical protein SAMN05216290_1082 [Roseivirga pacifica]
MIRDIKKGDKKERLDNILQEMAKADKKGFDASKYSGTLKLEEDPVAYQNKLRDEWE